MISTQRLILLLLALNLVIGIADTIYQNPTSYDENTISLENDLYEDYAKQLKDDDPYSAVKNQNIQQESSIGNSLSWGKILLDIFLNGLNPFSFQPSDFDTAIEQITAIILIIFRGFMYILVIIEVIMFFKNKKAT